VNKARQIASDISWDIAAKLMEDGEEDHKDYVMRTLPGMEKYIVISWDPNEEQIFWDTVPAKSEDDARKEVAHVRNYAHVIDVLDIDQLSVVLDRLKSKSLPTVRAEWNKTKEWHPEL